MKQSIKGILCIAIALFAFSKIEAQVTFKPGIRAGVNLSHFSKGDGYTYYYDSYNPYLVNNNDGDFSSKAGFYVGFIGELHLTKYYTLQPEVLYTNQGSKVRTPSGNEFNLDVSYLSVGIVNKFTFNSFNIHVGPTVDVEVDSNFDTDNDLDLGFQLGAGYNFTKNLGLEARIKRGVIPVVDTSSNHDNVVYSLGLSYTFDLK
jgi:Outer membrane protein beta-barrel domain